LVQDVVTSRKVAMRGDRSDVRGRDEGCNGSVLQKASSLHSVELMRGFHKILETKPRYWGQLNPIRLPVDMV
jgi:hypothetical protein